MQPPPAHLIHVFGDFELDTRRRVLSSRAGQPVEITGRVLDALIFLVGRSGQLVDKKSLIEALWPHVVVEEGNLTQTIHTLRRVLGEAPGDHRYIATVPGRGYRFVAEVSLRNAQSAPEAIPARRPKSVLAVFAVSAVLLGVAVVTVLVWLGRGQPDEAVAVRTPQSIAVLPFVDMSAEQDQAHFADGLSEEILNQLAHADALRVIARTSSFSFRDQNVDIKTIAQRLAVSHVLEGSVRKSGERVRITAQLIDASNSAHIWSETYDRDVHDIFGVQSEIAGAVADALHIKLRRAGPRRAETSSTEAYEHYLQGRLLFYRRSGGDLVQAKAHFENAIRIDPNYARAWSALAGVYLAAHYEEGDFPDGMRHWREAAERAVALAPDSAEAQFRAAQYYLHAGDQAKARLHVDRALALDPEDPLLIGRSLSHLIGAGRLDEAIELQKKVVARDPLSATERGNLGSMLMAAGRLAEAQAELERSLELSPTALHSTMNISEVLLLQGRKDEALKVIPRIPAGYRRDQRFAIAYFARGETSQGDVMLARLIEAAKEPKADADLAISVAEVYAQSNDFAQAFDWLDTALKRMRSQSGILPAMVMRENLQLAAFLQPLHADPRWDRLLAEIGSPQD
jgi:TolB-like protein/DNA-binding winged helix-turn-helix (wHTH) protein/Tfp pilus assembly protein PilF